jgi:hypothetical protein
LRLNLNVVRQFLLNLGQPRFYSLGHLTAVFASQHHGRADDGFLSVDSRRAGSESRSVGHVSKIFDQQWLHAGREFYRQIPDVLDRVRAGDGTNRELLPAAADYSASGVFHVRFNHVRQLAEGHSSSLQIFRPRLNDELPLVAATFVDIGDARNCAQQRLDCIFLNLVQLE